MTRSRSWLGLALGLAWACTGHRAPAGRPTVELVPARLDLGLLTQNQSAQGTVQLHNHGPRAVRLAITASSARCRWPGLPAMVAPGAGVPLSVTCQSDLLGPLREQVMVWESPQGNLAATLEIVGKVEPLVGFDTSFVDLRPAFGQAQSADIHLVGPRAHLIRPKVATTGNALVTASTLPADAGHRPGFRITCQGSKVGMHAGSLVVDTGLPEQPTLTLSWGCRVPATLQVEPSNPYFNLHISGERATTITVRSTQPDFAVTSARVTEGPFSATVEKTNPDHSVLITIRVKNDEIPDDARSASGKLLIESNDQREPSKEVPLFGLGKINKVPPQ